WWRTVKRRLALVPQALTFIQEAKVYYKTRNAWWVQLATASASDEFEDGLGTAGNVGRGGSPLNLFLPPCCFEPAILEESVGDHRHERMTVKALPGSALEVIETKFFFQLLVSLLANPSHLDGGR